MNEYLIPTKYVGNDFGISVQIAGLNEETYSLLEISIDGNNFVSVKRDENNLFNSESATFSGLNQNKLYTIQGRITINDEINIIECKIVSQDGTIVDTFDASKLPRVNIKSPVSKPIVSGN